MAGPRRMTGTTTATGTIAATDTPAIPAAAALPQPAVSPRRADRCLVVGILNVAPDSFSDGGRYYAPDAAIAHAMDMTAAGADYIDVGGESTRPGATRVSAEGELRRVLPVVTELARRGI